MQYGIAPFHSFLYTMWISNIARKNFKLTFYIIGTLIQPTPGIKRVVVDEGADSKTLTHQSFCEV
jgi:hypothetical protein